MFKHKQHTFLNSHLFRHVQNMDWTGQLDWTVELDYWTGLRIRFFLFDRRNLNDSKIYKYF